MATVRRAAAGHGSSFSPAMNAAISAIHPRLMTPTAKRAANTQRVGKLAADEARKRGDRKWDREHILLALCQLSGKPGVRGAEILERLGKAPR